MIRTKKINSIGFEQLYFPVITIVRVERMTTDTAYLLINATLSVRHDSSKTIKYQIRRYLIHTSDVEVASLYLVYLQALSSCISSLIQWESV